MSTSEPPAWLDRRAYPFTSRYLDLEMGRLHYIDEGQGAPVVMVHGNPAWSFLYRDLVKSLSAHYRCVAMDHIGFGLSDKPTRWSYRAEAHARNLEALLDTLALEEMTLVVQDWGGPIGLSYALRRPEKVRRLVLLNTWMWPVDDEPFYRIGSTVMGSPLGRLLIERFNFYVRVLMPLLFGDRTRFTPEARRHYRCPLDRPEARRGCWVFTREVLGATPWLAALWAERQQLAGKPVAIVWGMEDFAFREKELARWRGLFPGAEVHRLEGVGHFIQEERGTALGALVGDFMRRTG